MSEPAGSERRLAQFRAEWPMVHWPEAQPLASRSAVTSAMLQHCASERASELPGADLTHPFGDEWDVYKVRGKVFMLQTELHGVGVVTVKARPGDANILREAFAEITPGYHMNKRHWITIRPGGMIDSGLIEDLVTESYLLVLEKSVPKSQWPVDPATFGQRDSPHEVI